MEYEIGRGRREEKRRGPGSRDRITKEMQFENAKLEQKLKYEMQIEENRKNVNKEQ